MKTATLYAPGLSVEVLDSVAPPPPAQTIDLFTATPNSITAGQSTTLSWSTSNATVVKLDGVVVSASGSVVKTPSSNATYTLVASGSVADVSATASVVVQAQSGSTPAWLANAAVGQWVTVPNSILVGSDISVQIAAGFVDNTHGRRDHGIMDYSGGSLKPLTSELLIHGGGGAGAWGGNDVRSLKLSDDAPAWRTIVPPSPPSALWSREPAGQPLNPQPYMRDGTPNACHSYWSPVYVPQLDKLFRFYTSAVYEDDSGFFPNTNAVSLATKTWDAAGAHPNVPGLGPSGANACITIDQATGLVYIGTYNDIYKYDPVADQFTSIYTNTTEPERGVIAVGLGVVLSILNWTNPVLPVAYDLTTHARIVGAFTGFIPTGGRLAGFVFCPDLQAFVLFCDDGNLYKITRTDATHWNCAAMTLTGTPPPANSSSINAGGGFAVWGRMQYVPALKGIVIVPGADYPAYFVRTT